VLLQNLRAAARVLKRNPTATVIVILTLALAIGTVSTVFSALNAVLLRQLPYPHP
jgi:cell division protein FtsX